MKTEAGMKAAEKELPEQQREVNPECHGMTGRNNGSAVFPSSALRNRLSAGHADTLTEIEERIRESRMRMIFSANARMVLMYWDVGKLILLRRRHGDRDAKAIDRLSADLREAYPEMKALSPRNLKHMRAFAAAWPDRRIVQAALAQLPWRHNIALLEVVDSGETRLWYAFKTIEQGWSRTTLLEQINSRAHERHGSSVTSFKAVSPPADADMAAVLFKDPCLSDFLGTATTPPTPLHKKERGEGMM